MKRIIIADDNDELLIQMQKNLEKCNEIDIVGIAKDGEEELDSIKKLLPDLVITDIEMPKMTGLEVIKELENFECNPEYIIITGIVDEKVMRQLSNIKIKRVFQKPINYTELMKEIIMGNIKRENIIHRNLINYESKSIIQRIKTFINNIKLYLKK